MNCKNCGELLIPKAASFLGSAWKHFDGFHYCKDNRTHAEPSNLSTPEPAPLKNDRTPIAELVIKDIQDRMEFGKAKYGMLLQANNGRNAGIDAYQEQLDHLIYFRQMIEERFLLLVAIAAELHGAGFTLSEATTTRDPKVLFRNILRAIEEARRVKAAHGALIRERDGEVWVWSTGFPEDGDNLRTITCPILIYPEQLQQIADGIAKNAANPFLIPSPIPMVLHCPNCNTQHIDKPQVRCDVFPLAGVQCVKEYLHERQGDPVHSILKEDERWTNPPHKSHLCHCCEITWRPAGVYTVGVESIPVGEKDTWPAK